jgi:hypothetical protein
MRGSARRASGWAVIPRAPRGLGGAILPRPPRIRRRIESRAEGNRSGLPASLTMRLAEIPLWPGAHTIVPRGPGPRRFRPFA